PPRAYRLKVGNADLFRNSTEPGTSPGCDQERISYAFRNMEWFGALKVEIDTLAVNRIAPTSRHEHRVASALQGAYNSSADETVPAHYQERGPLRHVPTSPTGNAIF
ncbi:hypothetical protein MXD81_16170, partial [Microbacteriaceae bacterium K1510]|nr:hypothetical protein [Microbacteriaceae bacterium K1510]